MNRLLNRIVPLIVLLVAAGCDDQESSPNASPPPGTQGRHAKTTPASRPTDSAPAKELSFGVLHKVPDSFSLVRQNPGMWVVFMTSEGCGNCEVMAERILTDANALQTFSFNEGVYLGHFNQGSSSREAMEVKRKWGIWTAPVVAFFRVDSKGNETLVKSRMGSVGDVDAFWTELYALSVEALSTN